MGFPRRYTKQETYKGLPIARDAERNTAIDTVALNSIKKMMDNGVGGKDDGAKLLRLDVAIPATLEGNNLFRKAQADIMKHYRRHDAPIEYVAYKHESAGGSVYKLAVLARNCLSVEDIADKTEKVFNHKLKGHGGEASVVVSAGAVVSFNGADAQSYREAFRESSTIAQVELSPEKTKVLFSSKG